MARDIYGDMEDDSRPRVRESRWHFSTNAGEMRHFITRAGPGLAPYPAEADSPTVYRVEWLKNVAYTSEVGAQTLTYDTTGKYDKVFNMEAAKYMEEGSIGIAWKMGRQWYTIDKVPRPYCTTRKYDLSGTLLWSKDHGAPGRKDNITSSWFVKSLAKRSDGTVFVSGPFYLNQCVREIDSAGEIVASQTKVVSRMRIGPDDRIFLLEGNKLRKYDFDWSQLWEYGIDGVVPESFAVDTGGAVAWAGNKSGGTGKWASRISSAGSFLFEYTSENFEDCATTSDDSVLFSGLLGSGNKLRKYNSSGTLLWTTSEPTIDAQIAVDSSDDCYVAGILDDSPFSTDDRTVLKINSSGSLVWHKARWDNAGQTALAQDVCVAVSPDGSLVAHGGFRSGLGITHQVRDSSNGDLIWEGDHGATVQTMMFTDDALYVGGIRTRV